jgi:hypothetical protein
MGNACLEEEGERLWERQQQSALKYAAEGSGDAGLTAEERAGVTACVYGHGRMGVDMHADAECWMATSEAAQWLGMTEPRSWRRLLEVVPAARLTMVETWRRFCRATGRSVEPRAVTTAWYLSSHQYGCCSLPVPSPVADAEAEGEPVGVGCGVSDGAVAAAATPTATATVTATTTAATG